MIQFYFIGTAIVGAVGAGITVYKRLRKEHNIGNVSLWGMEAAGKTTLILRLKKEYVPGDKPKSTNTRTPSSNIVNSIADRKYIIKSITDYSGIKEAKKEWMKEIDKAAVIIYLVNMEKYIAGKDAYQGRVHVDFSDIEERYTKNKKLVIVGTHIDQTSWAHNPSSIHDDDVVIQLKSKFEKFDPDFYPVNFLDDNSYSKFLERFFGSF